MARFTRTQCTQSIVFCLYWFAVFPIVWFVVQPEFFVDNLGLTILLAVILLLIYYIIYRLIKCCCSQDKEGEGAGETAAANNVHPRYRQPRGNSMEGIENRVYCPTTTTEAEQPPRRVVKPDAVVYEHVPLSQKKLLPDAEEPAAEAEEDEAKNVRFITSCSLYYDGQGHFHDYK